MDMQWHLWQTQIHALDSLEPWSSSLLHTSEFLGVFSLLYYFVLGNSNLPSVVCDLYVFILSPRVCNSLRAGATFLWPFVQPDRWKQGDFLNFSWWPAGQPCLSADWQSVPRWSKGDFRGARTPLQKQGRLAGWGVLRQHLATILA